MYYSSFTMLTTSNKNVNSIIASYLCPYDMDNFFTINGLTPDCSFVLDMSKKFVHSNSYVRPSIVLPLNDNYLLTKYPMMRMRKIYMRVDDSGGKMDYKNANKIINKLYYNIDCIKILCTSRIYCEYLHQYVNLRKLYVESFNSMFIDVYGLERLRKLYVYSDVSKECVVMVRNCPKLRFLDIKNMENCVVVDKPRRIVGMKLFGCVGMSRVDFLRNFVSLVSLSIWDVEKLDLSFLGECVGLRKFELVRCDSVDRFDVLGGSSLRSLSLIGCRGFDYDVIELMRMLRYLRIDRKSVV